MLAMQGIAILGGLLVMMGQQDRSEALFCHFRLEDQVPENHLLRLIEKHISFAFVREKLRDSYSETGRPSIDPERLLRILLIGYLYGITSERKLVEELRMHLAWRWFTGLGFDQEIPHHATFSLGAEPGTSPCFGYKARVPLANGQFDRTEVDLRMTDLLVEAKLTESDFQSAEKGIVWAYRDFSDVFDRQQLPQTSDRYFSYQLLRNVLAAYAQQCSFCVLLDSRRPDLADAWYAVMKCVRPVGLRIKLRILTWQEVAQDVPPKLQAFLATKYGINPPNH